MDTFEDLYEEELANMLGSVGVRIGNKIAAVPDRLLARIGSLSAKGRLSHRKMTMDLYNGFREYCGEQRISQPLLDDVLQYIGEKYGLAFGDETETELIYGKNIGAENPEAVEDVIALIKERITNDLAVDETILTHFNKLVRSQGNEIALRKGLFHLFRENPGRQRLFNPFREYIGSTKRINAPKTRLFFERIAQILIRKSTGKEDTKSGKDAGEDEINGENVVFGRGKAVNNNLDEPPSETSALQNLRSEEFWTELGSYGISARMMIRFGTAYRRHPEDLVDLLRSRYSDEMCVKIARSLMQIFSHTHLINKFMDYLKPIVDEAKENGDDRTARQMQKMLTRTVRLLQQPNYDRSQINNDMYRTLQQTKSSAFQFLAAIMICVYEAGRNLGMFKESK